MTKVFIIGGPGNISRGTIDYLQARSYQLAIFTRHTEEKKSKLPGVAFYEGSRGDSAALRLAFEDFGAELVIDTICFEPADAKALHDILRDRIRHLVFVSSVDAYGYSLSRLPFSERDAFRAPTPGYAANKRAIELFYEDRFRKTGFPVTIGRPTLSIGPDFCPMMFLDWGVNAVARIKAGRPILVPGDGNGLMHVGWGYDVGRMIGRMIGDENCVGRDYTLSDEHCMSRDDYISLFTEIVGRQTERVYIPPEYIERFDGVEGMFKIPHLYRFNMAFSLARFKHDFPDYRWLPLRKGVEEFVQVNEERGAFAAASAEIVDDRIIAAWKQRLADW
jgi:nucleoside-diphosphate-sugar epimerase